LVNDHKQAVIIDAGMYETREQQRFVQYIQSHQLTPVALLITHAHPDHICGQEFIEKTYGLSAIIKPAEGTLTIDGFAIQVISTPGHKEDCVCYYLPKENILFTGDTLFQESIGRTDLPGGDMHELILSLHKLVVLPEETKVYPGHGYSTSIAHERQYNPYF
jgi:glyoxylase-like metal-dependent hydrolase (beta-lactamase superfamily II)